MEMIQYRRINGLIVCRSERNILDTIARAAIGPDTEYHERFTKLKRLSGLLT
jgi:hypothetical protein